jgi:hypothetical protein
VLSSYLGWVAGNPERTFGFPRLLQENAVVILRSGQRQFPSQSFPAKYTAIVLSSDAILSQD